MHVIQLPNGNLLVPESVLADEGQLIGDAYVEIGPADADYDRLAAHAITEDELRRSAAGGARATRSCSGSSRSTGPAWVWRPGR